ncbi:MAG: K(+)-transporting ATPase subunit C [Smithella sp.]|jgi:K+-transporting ATPase ATPase C chain
MIKNILNELRISVIATVCLAVLLCGIYPAVVWLIAQGIFPEQANGSLVSVKGQVVGSSLLAQRFAGAGYFHPRPSAAGDGYDAVSSSGSNLGPTSQKLIAAVKERVAVYRAENKLAPEVLIPADAVTASGSGLDPHISVKNALLQASRVARVRGAGEEALRKMIASHIEGRDLGIFGEPRVNVLMLNLDMNGKQ